VAVERRVMTETCRFSLPWELEEIANLFCLEVLTSVKRSIDVLKLERQRLVTKNLWPD